MIGFLVTPMKLNDVIAILGIFSAAGSLYVFATLKDITGDAIDSHNTNQYAHPVILERFEQHNRTQEILGRDILSLHSTIRHNQQIFELIQAQNDKNHQEVMAAIRRLESGGGG
jgi:hypothetical protein